MNKSESKYFNTAVKIDEAFLELLSKKSFEYITVKEICQKAGVNRSTFYLHYDTIDDLLTECNEYLIKKFLNTLQTEFKEHKDIRDLSKEESNFLTPKYLMPWLEYIKQNKILFKTYIGKFHIVTIEKNNKLLFKNIANPVLQKFNIKEKERAYILNFYVEGVMSIVKLWVANDCVDDVSDVCRLISDRTRY